VSLNEIRSRLRGATILLDFDGTLAPIVERPEDARPLPGTAAMLAGLRPRVRRLAIVTGRPAAFVEASLPGIEVAGLYGAQGAPPIDPTVRAAVAGLASGEPGARVEDKGAALAVHIRQSADPGAVAARLRRPLADVAASAGLRFLEGKRVLELAAGGSDKGEVVRRLARGADALLVAGDDLPDLAAFEEAGRIGEQGSSCAGSPWTAPRPPRS